ncbi:PEP/pyruvate-binding domain-containing protein [bacterium]|nr:PEP/pyruvate-binding domain-containing protein [bacterium]
MARDREPLQASDIPAFDRDRFGREEAVSAIGAGAIGGKATGLANAQKMLRERFPEGRWQGIEINVPTLAVLATGLFDAFMQRNNLWEIVREEQPDHRIANAFLRAEFPSELVGDLRALVEKTTTPLAVRSSSMLEDATFEPFAGIYATKMIPNNQPDADTRFRKLIEAVKFVYASTFFAEARGYMAATGRAHEEEKMAVVIQEVVGLRYQDRFYPTISGVAKSYNFYPSGKAKPEQGVVSLALGLGKTIVDGSRCWTYSPAFPKADPPLTIRDLLNQTQKQFWAVNMGQPSAYDPMTETEYLLQAELSDAEYDDTLRDVASTYQPENDRVVIGTSRPGPRIVNFAPIIRMDDIKLNALVVDLLKYSEESLGTEVEIEFAVTIDPLRREPVRFGFLQVRPIVVSLESIELTDEDMAGPNVIAASEKVLGNGTIDSLTDIVYVKPEVFAKEKTRVIAGEIALINRALQAEGRHCILVFFGRLGSSDPWLGIPVDWGQISTARVMVEATLPDMDVELSQGSHFFQNMTSLQICYFNIHHAGRHQVNWDLLNAGPVVAETEHVRHVRLQRPCTVKVDGRTSRGVILK